jgi:hypothetical protein
MTGKGLDGSNAMRLRVYVRRADDQKWYGDKKWYERRAKARTFSSALEALLVCREEQLRGFVVGFNGQNQKVFQLPASEVLDTHEKRRPVRDS